MKNEKYTKLASPYLLKEQGSMMLFIAAILIPILFVFFSLTLDFEQFFGEKESIQHLADQAALYGYRFLPNKANATAATKLYLTQNSSITAISEVTVTADSVTVDVNKTSNLTFANLASLISHSSTDPIGIPLSVHAVARGVPIDAFVMMDTSTYLAPSISDSVPWIQNGERSLWPSAQFFSSTNLWDIRAQMHEPAYVNEVVSQSCFNQIFSKVKKATIGAYQKLANFRLNAVGLGFYPSVYNSVDVARAVRSLDTVGIGEAGWIASPPSQEYVRNELCFAAADMELSHTAYRFPTAPASLEYQWKSPSTGAPAMKVIPGVWNINPEVQPFLSVPQIIWSQAVRVGVDVNTPAAILQGATQIYAANSWQGRGGLTNRAARVLVVLAGDVPRVGGLRYPNSAVETALGGVITQIKAYASGLTGDTSHGIIIYYVLTDMKSSSVSAEATTLDAYFKTQSTQSVRLQLVYGSDPEVMANAAVNAVLAESRRGVISK